ncbi:hypothetical protein KUV28_21840 [Ferrimonas balearica]|nr:hypothetical protein [Ferrimonas balearica]
MDYNAIFPDVKPAAKAPDLPRSYLGRDPDSVLARRFFNRGVSVSADTTGCMLVSLHGSPEPLDGALVQYVQTVRLKRKDAVALRDRLSSLLEDR